MELFEGRGSIWLELNNRPCTLVSIGTNFSSKIPQTAIFSELRFVSIQNSIRRAPPSIAKNAPCADYKCIDEDHPEVIDRRVVFLAFYAILGSPTTLH